MSTADIITSYEKHLEANWTREGERIGSTFGLNWKDMYISGWTCKFCSQPVARNDFSHHYLDRVHPECLKNNAN